MTERMEGLGAEKGLEELSGWLETVNAALKIMEPVSVIETVLQLQTTECAFLLADIENHKDSVRSVNASVGKWIESMKDPVKLMEVRDRLSAFNAGLEMTQLAIAGREVALSDVSQKTKEFRETLKKFTNWLMPTRVTLKSGNLGQLSMQALKEKVRTRCVRYKPSLEPMGPVPRSHLEKRLTFGFS